LAKVAICLLTCGREHYTARTLHTLAQHNDLSKFLLLHGNDVVGVEENSALASRYGFETVLAPKIRQGCSQMVSQLFIKASIKGAEWVLHLENDWESDSAIPVDVIPQMDESHYCARLYGVFKGRGALPCHTTHFGRAKQPVAWEPWIGGWEVGSVHWGFPPAITRMREARFLTCNIQREQDAMHRSGVIGGLTVRPVTNVMSHIGEERTPVFFP
jgi:hypothetical protein